MCNQHCKYDFVSKGGGCLKNKLFRFPLDVMQDSVVSSQMLDIPGNIQNGLTIKFRTFLTKTR